MSIDLGSLTNHCECFECPACPHPGVERLVCSACSSRKVAQWVEDNRPSEADLATVSRGAVEIYLAACKTLATMDEDSPEADSLSCVLEEAWWNLTFAERWTINAKQIQS